MKAVRTRFRAYQLGNAGSAFSYFAGNHFTVIEARITEMSRASLIGEMKDCGVQNADVLHLTSWDTDHCAPSELEELLSLTSPSRIEYPGYEPKSDSAKDCRKILEAYRSAKLKKNLNVALNPITPDYISGLGEAQNVGFQDILYHPRWIDTNCANNNSTIKFFRRGSFNVLSLGDVETNEVSTVLRRQKVLTRETDVMILAHHGADNGFTNKNFLQALKPQLAICSSNYDNQYDHPKEEIRQLLYEEDIRLMTTKTGDILVESIDGHSGKYKGTNYKSNSQEVSSEYIKMSKKSKILSYNEDTIRQLYAKRPNYPRR